jgi:hypothetical protein
MAIIGQGVQAGLGRIDYSPYMQGAVSGAQGIAQGVAQFGQSVSTGIQNYLKKEHDKKIKDEGVEFIKSQFPGIGDKEALAGLNAAGGPAAYVKFRRDESALADAARLRKMQLDELQRQEENRVRVENLLTQTPAAAAIAEGKSFENLPTGVSAFLPRQFGNAQELLQAGQRAGIPVTQLLSVAKGLADINRVEAETRAALAPKGTPKTETYKKTEGGIPYEVTVRTNTDGTTTELGRVRTDIQPGMRAADGGGQEPIPGSEIDLKRKAAQESVTKLYDSGLRQGAEVLQAIARAKDIVKNAKTPVQGFGSTMFGWTPIAEDLDAQYNQIRGINVLDTIRQARAESPTGGSPFGQMNMKEFDAAGAVKGAVNRNMSDQSVLTNMDTIAKGIFTAYPQLKEKYKYILEGADVKPAPRLKVGRFSGDIVSP